MEITRDQASNFWCYCRLTSNLEFNFNLLMPEFFGDTEENFEKNRRIYYDDVQIKRKAESLAGIINRLNLPEDGEDNVYVGVMCLARAFVNHLNDAYDNDTYMNPGSFWLICCRIAIHVNK